MHIIKNIKNFLLDQEYYIDIFNNYIHVYHYDTIIHLSENLIKLKLEKFNIEIEGQELIVSSMNNKEILIKGIINNMRFVR